MAYMNKEMAAEIRNELKAKFPKFKFSVRVEDHMAIRVAIKSAPIRFVDGDYATLSHMSLDKMQHAETYKKISDIVNKNNYDNSDIMSDYHDVGYYVRITQGDWNNEKPFILSES